MRSKRTIQQTIKQTKRNAKLNSEKQQQRSEIDRKRFSLETLYNCVNSNGEYELMNLYHKSHSTQRAPHTRCFRNQKHPI